MGEKQRILDLLDRAHRAHAWHGPALLETLAGLNPTLAARRPLEGVHSIWALVEHVASWNEIVAMRLAGGKPVVTNELNFPPVPKPTTAAWKATLAHLEKSHVLFRREVERFPENKFGRKRPKTNQTWNVLIHGQIQHGLYHAGQIAMLRRALGKPISA